MRSKHVTALVAALAVLLTVSFIGIGCQSRAEPADTTAASMTTAQETTAETTVETTVEATAEETTEATTEPEPQEIRYTLTFGGDCTLGNMKGDYGSQHSFMGVVGKNYEYPFVLLKPWFATDDFTLVNFEGTLTNYTGAVDKAFNFHAPPEYAQILITGSVECVTLSNNHIYDYGMTGYQDTVDALNRYGIPFAEDNGTCLYTTKNGLVIGVYADQFYMDPADIQAGIASLQEAGAEIIIASFHWGIEKQYTPTYDQVNNARIAIDAGADIVFGHHPHVLQPIEEYNGGIIYYSLSNCSFGGNTSPYDWDIAIVQQEVIRAADGTVSLGKLTVVPCCVSSSPTINNYQPMPLHRESADYRQVLDKLGLESETFELSGVSEQAVSGGE